MNAAQKLLWVLIVGPIAHFALHFAGNSVGAYLFTPVRLHTLAAGGQTGDVRWDAADELRLLVTHGVLHICGWDHATPLARGVPCLEATRRIQFPTRWG